MNYQQALEYIHGTYKFGSKLGLENIKYLLNLLGNPQEQLQIIHVAGTNGKGSTCSFIHSILKEEGYRVGLYTSPYLEVFAERIRINGENIPEEKLGEVTAIVKEKIEQMLKEGRNHPTEFEVVTAIALYYYAQEKVEFLVLEVGLGGRLDATNAIQNPLISVITPIDYDHMEYLGDTLKKIAYEKGGIIKENNYVVSYPQKEEAAQEIQRICDERKTKLFEVKFDTLQINSSNIEGQVFSIQIFDKKYDDVKIQMLGEHQIHNCYTAIGVIEVLKRERNISISKEALYRGVYNATWAGRLEVMLKKPITIIDGAHNLQGAEYLGKSMEKLLPNKKITLVMGMLQDKDVEGVLNFLIPRVDKIITTSPNNPRAMSAKELAKKIEIYKQTRGLEREVIVEESIKDAVKVALEITDIQDAIVFTGSLYMIGEVRTLLINKN